MWRLRVLGRVLIVDWGSYPLVRVRLEPRAAHQ